MSADHWLPWSLVCPSILNVWLSILLLSKTARGFQSNLPAAALYSMALSWSLLTFHYLHMIVPRWKWAKWREVITHVRCRWLSLWGEASPGQARHVGDVLRPILLTLANCTIIPIHQQFSVNPLISTLHHNIWLIILTNDTPKFIS